MPTILPLRIHTPLFVVLGYLVVWIAAAQHDPFFWDTVQLGSKHAHFFYENGLHWAPLPEEIDSGHPPVFGYYLAAVWSIFGKSLPVSHWAMLPFLVGTAVLLYRMAIRMAGHGQGIWLFPMVFLDPVLAGQSTLMSPDIVLACCFLVALEGLLTRRYLMILAGVAGLCAISTRGMMTAAALVCWQTLIWLRSGQVRKVGIPTLACFTPGFAFAAWFLWWHHSQTGWTGYHAGSPWAPAFTPAQGLQLVRNATIIGWRWTDFGRIFEWLMLGYLLLQPKNRIWKSPFFSLFVWLAVLLTPTALFYNNLSAHRYFLPFFLGLHLLVFEQLATAPFGKTKKTVLFTLLVFGLATGNRWIYPRGVSMDWDATLAGLPYYRLQQKALAYLDGQNIDFQKVGTAFPNINTGEHLYLNGDSRTFSGKDFDRNTYILASNIYNDFSEADFGELTAHWKLIRRWEHAGVWIELFQKPKEPG